MLEYEKFIKNDERKFKIHEIKFSDGNYKPILAIHLLK